MTVESGAVFVLPTTDRGQQGPVAAYMSTAGWAAAAARVLGAAWIVGPDGPCSPDDLRARGSRRTLTAASAAGWTRKLPVVAKTLVKDLQRFRRARRFDVPEHGPWDHGDVAFVWQRHDLFCDAGLRLAARLGAPSVLFVPATTVWEAEQWGVRRPGWGRFLERVGERPALRGASVVACGSDLVAEQVLRLGTPAERVILTPTGVDLSLFAPDGDRDGTRRALGLSDRFVVGWVGSFRSFHSLELAVDAAAEVPGSALLLVGDGPQRPAIENYARARGVDAVCTGTVAHADLARHLRAMDVGLVLAASRGAFHYSPLKLAEYMAAGLPVVAPDVGQLADRLRDGVDALLVPPGDHSALVAALRTLRDDSAHRARLGAAARAAAVERWSWDHAVRAVLGALERGAVRRPAARRDAP